MCWSRAETLTTDFRTFLLTSRETHTLLPHSQMLRHRGLSVRLADLDDKLAGVLRGGVHGHVVGRHGAFGFPSVVSKAFFVERDSLVVIVGGFENQARA